MLFSIDNLRHKIYASGILRIFKLHSFITRKAVFVPSIDAQPCCQMCTADLYKSINLLINVA